MPPDRHILPVGRPPVIVIGMHRSGTSMIARSLEELGLFMGARKEINNEATFFLSLNEWLLRSAGGAWDNPAGIDDALGNETLRALLTESIGLQFHGWPAAEYWGLWRRLVLGSRRLSARPWGWKDPRNTYTLPFWLDLFPQARIVHVLRHGVDVAHSLKIRSEKELAAVAHMRRKRAWIDSFRMRRNPLVSSAKTHRLEEGFRLWEMYVTRARGHASTTGERWLEVKFEDYLAAPSAVLRDLAAFGGLPIDDNALASAARKADASRAYNYRNDPALSAFAVSVAARLAALGYE